MTPKTFNTMDEIMQLKSLNDKIIYARGWNEAVRAAAAIVRGFDIQGTDSMASTIEALDKSMQACDND